MNRHPKTPQPEPDYQPGTPILAPEELKKWLLSNGHKPDGTPKRLKIPCVVEVGRNPLSYVDAVWVGVNPDLPAAERLYLQVDDTGMGISFNEQARHLSGGTTGWLVVYLYGTVGKLLNHGPMGHGSASATENEIDFALRRVELFPLNELHADTKVYIEVAQTGS